MPAPDISIADLATELGTTVRDIAGHVSDLCRNTGPAQTVHLVAPSRARTIVRGPAADTIRARYADA
ncbi:hypothetical protein [Kitasatospora sp. McL0602]|uniref:hypothetical protein n=1 Tax=Kitasatospora sp. McL0602 TaxID=3439530 RepID=UPI003F89EFD5